LIASTDRSTSDVNETSGWKAPIWLPAASGGLEHLGAEQAAGVDQAWPL
jgi:hypothetical protein